MYRPGGDNQVWPVITALSHFNFGDPTDAFKYGEGIGGFHAVILLPYAHAFKMFGVAGYMMADAFLSWCYLIAAMLLFRRCGLGAISSLVLSASLATTALQVAMQKLSQSFERIVVFSGHSTSEWGIPNLFNLLIFGKRVPRPMPTEIFIALILYFLVRQWQERRPPTLARGLAIGALMGLLVQGDPYSFSALGLVLLAVTVRGMAFQKWKLPWRFAAGGLAGAALTSWYFVVQTLAQHPDSPARFGLAKYARDHLLFLPGGGPWFRIAMIALLILAARLLYQHVKKQLASASASSSKHELHVAGADSSRLEASLNTGMALTFFAGTLVLAAWLAQPIQLFLLGKGAQTFHYLLYTLPLFYSYAIVLLMIQLFRMLNLSRMPTGESPPPPAARGSRGLLVAGALFAITMLGIEDALTVINYSGVSRREVSPWSMVGDTFRPNFRALDKEFRANPELKEARTVATFCQEANFLLTAFHGKRAYLPDNAFTTLGDEELENRLCEVARICQMKPETFTTMISDWYTLNFWLGCAKYWCASDYKFAPEDDYDPEQLSIAKQSPKQAPFNLVLPLSERNRIVEKYEDLLELPPDLGHYPDTVVTTFIERMNGVEIDPSFYREVYTNAVFAVYVKAPAETNAARAQ
jgi:hypothetical protein